MRSIGSGRWWGIEVAVVTLTINAREYKVTCDDGQEPHLLELARMVEERVMGLVDSVGQVGEARLLMMTSLLIADELQSASRGGGNGRPSPLQEAPAADDRQAAELLERCANRLESIAAHLERD